MLIQLEIFLHATTAFNHRDAFEAMDEVQATFPNRNIGFNYTIVDPLDPTRRRMFYINRPFGQNPSIRFFDT